MIRTDVQLAVYSALVYPSPTDPRLERICARPVVINWRFP